MLDAPQTNFVYKGFSSPNGTIVPDDVFDVLLPQLTDPELRVLLYIIRKTFGWKKDSDNISLNQMVSGVTSRDGRVIDRGAGLSRSSVIRGVRGLTEKGIIKAVRNVSKARGNESTTYQLRFEGDPLSNPDTRGGGVSLRQGLVSDLDTQETTLQTTGISHSNIRKGTPQNDFVDNSIKQSVETYQTDSHGAEPVRTTNQTTSVSEDNNGFVGDPETIRQWGMEALGDIVKRRRGRPTKQELEEREMIQAFIRDFAHEFHDHAMLKSSVTRAYNIYKQSGMPPTVFQDCLYQARLITKDYQSRSLIKESPMAYYFRVLEDKSGVNEHPYSPTVPN